MKAPIVSVSTVIASVRLTKGEALTVYLDNEKGDLLQVELRVTPDGLLEIFYDEDGECMHMPFDEWYEPDSLHLQQCLGLLP